MPHHKFPSTQQRPLSHQPYITRDVTAEPPPGPPRRYVICYGEGETEHRGSNKDSLTFTIDEFSSCVDLHPTGDSGSTRSLGDVVMRSSSDRSVRSTDFGDSQSLSAWSEHAVSPDILRRTRSLPFHRVTSVTSRTNQLKWLCDNAYPRRCSSVHDPDIRYHEARSQSLPRLMSSGNEETFDFQARPTFSDDTSASTVNGLRFVGDKFGACLFTVTGFRKFDGQAEDAVYGDDGRCIFHKQRPVGGISETSSTLERHDRRHKYIRERTMARDNLDNEDNTQKYLCKAVHPHKNVFRMEREIVLNGAKPDVLQYWKANANSLPNYCTWTPNVHHYTKHSRDGRLRASPNRFRNKQQIDSVNGKAAGKPARNTASQFSEELKSNLPGERVPVNNDTKADDQCVNDEEEDEEPQLSVAQLKLKLFGENKSTACARKTCLSAQTANIIREPNVKKQEPVISAGKIDEKQQLARVKPPVPVRKSTEFYAAIPSPHPTKISQSIQSHAEPNSKSKQNKPHPSPEMAFVLHLSENPVSQVPLHPANQTLNDSASKKVNCIDDSDFGWIDDEDVLDDTFYAGNQCGGGGHDKGESYGSQSRDVLCCVQELDEDCDAMDSHQSTNKASTAIMGARRQCAVKPPMTSPIATDEEFADGADNSLDAIVRVNDSETATVKTETKSGNLLKDSRREKSSVLGKSTLTVANMASRFDTGAVKCGSGQHETAQFYQYSLRESAMFCSAPACKPVTESVDCHEAEGETQERQCSIKELVQAFEEMTEPFMRTGSFRSNEKANNL